MGTPTKKRTDPFLLAGIPTKRGVKRLDLPGERDIARSENARTEPDDGDWWRRTMLNMNAKTVIAKPTSPTSLSPSMPNQRYSQWPNSSPPFSAAKDLTHE